MVAKKAGIIARLLAIRPPGIKSENAAVEILAKCAYIVWQLAKEAFMNVQTSVAEQFRVSPQRAADLSKFGFSSDEIYRIVAPRRTLDRRKKNNEQLTVAESDRVQRLERVTQHAYRVFGNEEKANRWLRKPCRALDKAVPLELLNSETGAQIVEGELHAIDHGMYV
jgi:putative toxin-antitoxin system antitoxin component (TIGR02293 family)